MAGGGSGGGGYLTTELSKRTIIFGFKLWVVLGMAVGGFIVIILFFLSMWLVSSRRKIAAAADKFQLHSGIGVIPKESKVIQEVATVMDRPMRGAAHRGGDGPAAQEDRPGMMEKIVVHVDCAADDGGAHGKFGRNAAGYVIQSLSHYDTPERGSPASVTAVVEEKIVETVEQSRGQGQQQGSTIETVPVASPRAGGGGADVSFLGWGHWYTLRELDAATHCFADRNVLGEGGYGIVYKGKLPDGTSVAVKNLLNNRGQAEKEFRVEVEAIGRVRHKNLVRLLGYCVEGCHRMLVYEYVDNGNLEQWLHGPISRTKSLTWESRMRILLGTAKALAYLHEALEPKVVHRDVKSSNILIDSSYNAKISDFGLAKLLNAGKSHVTTRVMGTFGYVAPEYANTGLLNERSDVYSFGVLVMEVITGRDPVDYSRPSSEVTLVDWFKTMVSLNRIEELVDPNVELRPDAGSIRQALLVAVRCVDLDSTKRPKMGHVVHMLERDDYPYRSDRRAAKGSNSAANRPPKSARRIYQQQEGQQQQQQQQRHYRAVEQQSRSRSRSVY